MKTDDEIPCAPTHALISLNYSNKHQNEKIESVQRPTKKTGEKRAALRGRQRS